MFLTASQTARVASQYADKTWFCAVLHGGAGHLSADEEG